ncbi:protein phosphatase 1 regulatory subunit 26 [Dipodomys merriami]|uniref:protein phosphatase 1 regulatory subunit 26 n=1 Tax=Dipodomys merriami TaxID=94247 RepID=UPI0038517913
MFLMNAPPVVPLQSRWEAFGPPGGFGFPTRASVSAGVRMIISSLPREEPLRGMSDGRATQRDQRAEPGRDARLGAGPAMHREQPVFVTCGLAADGGPLGREEAVHLDPSVLDSDSDDSVDRGIEEAIQEYLRAKSGAPQPSPSAPPPWPAPPPLSPPTGAPSSVSTPGSSAGAGQGSTSPGSVSSEDSFEQSIRAEIEQFLHDKRQHENKKGAGPVDGKTEPGDSAATRLKPCREPPPRAAPRQDPAGAYKEFVFRKHPRLAKANAQPKAAEPDSPSRTRLAVPRPEAAQQRGRARRNASAVRRGRRLQSVASVPEASDSSSDDGIEEAIQLYQLEKTRKEASGDPPPRAPLREERGPDTPASGVGSTLLSPVLEAHGRTPSKKKPAAPKAVGVPGGLDPDHPSKAPAPPGHAASRSESAEQASCQAEASAELMCAEAILDISKTILPAPGQGGDPRFPRGPLFCAPATPAHSGGDSSAVDSDDSIEQEIRTFLALKAQVGNPQPAQHPLSPPGPRARAGPTTSLLSKPLEQPAGCKRKRRGGGGSAPRPTTPKKTRDPVDSAQSGSHSQTVVEPGCEGQDSASQAKASKAPAGQSEAKSQSVPSRTLGLIDSQAAPGFGNPRKADKGGSVREKESSEDKSSSLDSDEDLDTAIKDLLRSKQKLKKRCRDPQAVGKKKVRFSTTETHFVDKHCGLPRDWAGGSPQVLRSCLSRSRGPSGAGLGPPTSQAFSSAAERTKAGGSGAKAAALAFQAGRTPHRTMPSWDMGASLGPPSASNPSSLSEDSSVDSDDSIELEIRKFLAEKAKECVSTCVQPGSHAALGPGGLARPEVLCRKEPAPQPGIRTRSQRARAGPLLTAGGWGTERAGAESAASLGVQGGKGASHAEQAARPPAALGRCEAVLPRGGSGNASAKTPSGGKRNTGAHRDQSPRGAEPAAAESAFGQPPSCARMTTEAAGSGSIFHLNYGSGTLLTPSPGPQADLTLPWSDFAHQSRLSSPWTLSAEGRGSPWTGDPGSLKGKGAEGPTRGRSGCTPGPRRSLPFASFPPRLSTQMVHFGKSISWGGRQASLFSPHLGLPLQSPAFSAFRETQVGHSPVFGSPYLLMKDSGPQPNRRAQGELRLHCRSLGSGEDISDLRYGHLVGDRDQQDLEALGSDASEYSDTSLEDTGSGAVVKGKALKL